MAPVSFSTARTAGTNVFESLDQVREISAAWVQTYNEERPHDALAGLPPATNWAQLEARTSPFHCLLDRGAYVQPQARQSGGRCGALFLDVSLLLDSWVPPHD